MCTGTGEKQSLCFCAAAAAALISSQASFDVPSDPGTVSVGPVQLEHSQFNWNSTETTESTDD